jgi:spermidine/putrescine transport system permease protein
MQLRKRLVPYMLGAPAGLWLTVFFLVPLVTLLSLSLQTCNTLTLECRLTWHWQEFPSSIAEYHTQFGRSVLYAGAATVVDIIVSFPLVYWIAFRARRKTVFLLLLLLPFFVSFVIRTLLWQFILSDQGIVFGTLKAVNLLPENFHILATETAVIAGIAYNYLPFAALPLFVALDRIDHQVVDAAHDLYATRRAALVRVILPLAIPGIFAATLLTFVPAMGDFVNAAILGGTGNTMIGNVIQNQFLVFSDYPSGSALSALLMSFMLVGVLLYSTLLRSATMQEYI